MARPKRRTSAPELYARIRADTEGFIALYTAPGRDPELAEFLCRSLRERLAAMDRGEPVEVAGFELAGALLGLGLADVEVRDEARYVVSPDGRWRRAEAGAIRGRARPSRA